MNDLDLLITWFATLDKIGANEDGSFSRLGYTDTEDAMIATVLGFSELLGFGCYTDEVGNTFIYDKALGDNSKVERTLIASHVDSVVSGGKYDGVAGVLAGLIVLKRIKEQGLNIPVHVGIFRMEESSVFGIATTGSKLVSGQITEATLKNAKEQNGVSLYDRIKECGFNPNPPKITGLKQYLELHIEQGRVLESKGLKLGVVSSIAAPVRMWVKFTGKQDHSGATPMDIRKDSLVAAAELVIHVEQAATNELNNASVGTTGIIRNTPNVFNVVPGETTLGLDIRGIDKASRQRVLESVELKAKQLAEKRGLELDINKVSSSDPVKLSTDLQNKLSAAANKLNIEHIVMPSGAGHDAMNFVDICPVGMLFIPCVDGISHNKLESASIADIVAGCDVLMEYLKSN